MAIKSLKNGAWEEIETLKVPANGAMQEADHANALVSGAWQEVWSNAKYSFTMTKSSHAAMYNTVTYTPNGDTASFTISASIPAQGYATGYIEISGDLDVPVGMNKSATFDLEVTGNNAVNTYIYATLTRTNGSTSKKTLLSRGTSGAFTQSFEVSIGSNANGLSKIMFRFEVRGNPGTFNATIKNLVVDGEKCKFV